MTIQFEIRGIKGGDKLRRQVAADLGDLGALIEVTGAHVALQCQREVTPAYQAVATLAVIGPAVHAAARDHTWPAAWRKVITRLREQMEERQRLHKARHESPAPARGPAGNRAKHRA